MINPLNSLELELLKLKILLKGQNFKSLGVSLHISLHLAFEYFFLHSDSDNSIIIILYYNLP